MPDNTFNPGMLVDPENYLKAQRAQMIAQALSQFAFTPANPTNPGPMASRESILSPLARALAGKMTGKALDRTMTSQIAVAQALRHAQEQSLTTPQAIGGTPALSASQAPVPGHVDQDAIARQAQMQSIYGVSPEVTKQFLANNAPTDAVKTGMQTGVSPEDVGAKQFGIGMRGGESLRLPGGRTIRNPNLSPNLEPQYAGDTLVGAHAIPGAAEGLGQVEQSQQLGKTLGGMVEVPQAGGGPAQPMLATDYFGLNKGGISAPAPATSPQPGAAPRTAAAPAAQDKYWTDMPTYKEPTGLGSQGTRSRVTSEAVVAEENKRRDSYGQLAKSAMVMSQNTEYMLPHLKNSTVGAGSDSVNHLRSLFAHTGWVAPETLNKLSDTEIVNKYLTRNGTEGLMARFGSRLAQAEVSLAVNKQSPNLTQQQRSILTLTVADQIKNAYDRQMAQDFKGYLSRGGDPREYETWYQEHHSLDDFSKQNAGNITRRVMDLYNGGSGSITKVIGGKTYVNRSGKTGDWEAQ